MKKIRVTIRDHTIGIPQRALIIALILVALAAVALTYPGSLLQRTVDQVIEHNNIPSDWEVFRTATLAMLNGENPYEVTFERSAGGERRFFNPPWTLVPLIPVAILPPVLGYVLFCIFSLAVFLAVGHRLGLSIWENILFVTSPMIIHGLVLWGNIEALPLLGLFMPAPLGLLFLAMKPQSTAVMMLLILYREYRRKGWRGLLIALLPLAALSVGWLLIYGLPEPRPLSALAWPWTMFAGVALGYIALRRDREDLALTASPMLSPYAMLQSWYAVLLVKELNWWQRVLLVVLWWLVFIYFVAG